MKLVSELGREFITACRKTLTFLQAAGIIFLLSLISSASATALSQGLKGTPVTLNKCWEYLPDGLAEAHAVVDRNNLYLPEDGGRITAVSLASGQRLWSSELGGVALSDLAVNGERLYVVTGADPAASKNAGSRLRSLSSATGITVFEKTLELSGRMSVHYSNGRIIIVAESGRITSISIETGNIIWTNNWPSISLSTVKYSGTEVVFATTQDHMIRTLDLATGARRLAIDTRYPATAVSMLGEDLVWGDDRGNIVRYSVENNSISWKYRNGARISSLVGAPDQILATSLDNFVYSIVASTGRVRWKKRQAARISDVPLVDDGFGIVLTVGEPNATFVDLANGTSVGQYTLGQNESFLRSPLGANGGYVFFTNRQVSLHTRKPCAK